MKENSSGLSLQQLVRNPDAALEELDRLDSQDSLYDFMRYGWHVLEPKREFVPGWHLEAICDHLTAVHHGDISRLLINIPPGCTKSLTTDVFLPAWEWGPRNRPDLRYVAASYSQDLTIRDNRRTRHLIGSRWYQSKWGKRFGFDPSQNAKTRFDNDAMGYKIATSVGGLGTGERGDRFIIDDPHNIKDGESDAKRNEAVLWFLETVPTRMHDPDKSAIIVIMQRVHEGDISGIIIERELGYTHLCLPMEYDKEHHCTTYLDVGDALEKGEVFFTDPRGDDGELLWPERMTRKVVERDKKVLGDYGTAGQFQQRPSPRGGGMFKRAWWRFYRTSAGTYRPGGCSDAPAIDLPKMDWMLQSIDASFGTKKATSSRVGALVIGGQGANRFVLDNRTALMDFKETVRTIRVLWKDWPLALRILIELKANGQAIIDTLHNEIPGIIGVTPEGGKESRAFAMQPAVQAGNWYLPEGMQWTDDFVTEFAMFPTGLRDDQVDAASQAAIFMMSGADVVRARMMSNY